MLGHFVREVWFFLFPDQVPSRCTSKLTTSIRGINGFILYDGVVIDDGMHDLRYHVRWCNAIKFLKAPLTPISKG